MSSIKSNTETIEKVLNYFREYGIPAHSSILVGFSGGPDSTALLQILADLRKSFPLTLYCAYLNHGIRSRKEIEEEAAFVKKVCSLIKVELKVKCITPGYLKNMSISTVRSLEDLAREERYKYFKECAEELGCDFIAVGHTNDDNIETLIMRFFQGAAAGLSGIPPRRGRIIRPLIYCSRQEILKFLHDRNRSYITDSTNLHPDYLRNAVRLKLIPVVESMFSGFRGSLTSLAEKMTLINEYFAKEANLNLNWAESYHGFRIKSENFIAAPGIIRIFSLYQLINMLNKGVGRVPYRYLSCLLDDEYIRKRRIILSGYGVRLYRKREYLFIERDIVCKSKKGYLIVVRTNRHYIVPNAGLRFKFYEAVSPVQSARLTPALGARLAPDLATNKAVAIDIEAAGDPIVVRSWKSGDRIRIRGGLKAVKKLFTEWRVPILKRWKMPIITDKQGIVAVLGEPYGYPNRFRPRLSQKDICKMTIGIEKLSS